MHKDSSRLQTMTAFNQKFLRGGLDQSVSASVNQLVSGSEGKKGSRVEGEKVRRLKVSIPSLYTNSNELYNISHSVAFPAASVQLKKPSVARRAYRSPMPWGRRQK